MQLIVPLETISVFSDFDLTKKHNKSIMPNKKYYIKIDNIDKYDNCKIIGIAYNDNIVFKYLSRGVFSFIYNEKDKDKIEKELKLIIIVYGKNNYKSKLFTLIVKKEEE